jgi:type I restriction enzyme M protein
MRIEEFATEKAWWTEREETEQAWRVDIDTIKAANYNLDVKNPHNADEGPGDPDELLAQYQGLQSAIADIQEQLKGQLAEALERTPEQSPLPSGEWVRVRGENQNIKSTQKASTKAGKKTA